MVIQSYWTRASSKRLSRRRVIAVSGASALAAAILAACGGDDELGGGRQGSGLVTKSVDTSKQAKTGGTYKGMLTQDIPTFEPTFGCAPCATHTQRAYQSMLVGKPGYLEPAKDDYEGDFIESWEFSPDRLTWTLKVRAGSKWDTRPPTSSRVTDASDVVFSWERYERVGRLRADYANSVNPAAPVISMTALDPRTVVVKLASPEAGILARFGARANSAFWILPKEAESGYDLRGEQRGSGPYTLVEYLPSGRFLYRRNPNYYNKELPRLEQLEYPIITEYAQGLAQFRNGTIYTVGVRPEDIVETKRAIPELALYQGFPSTTGFRCAFGWEDGPKSPFRDIRLRQAFSMALDRDLFIDTFYDVKTYEAEGLSMERFWNSAVRLDKAGWWLDPQSKDFGENAKFYKHDVAEAKKLLSAAGFANGLDVNAHHITTADYGADFPRQTEVLIGMAQEVGLRLRSLPADFLTEWLPKYRTAQGHFDGMAFYLEIGGGDQGDFLFSLYNSSGSQFQGWDPDGKSTFKGDPFLDETTTKIRREFDQSKRYGLAHDLQKYEAKMQYQTMFPGGTNDFNLAWPVLGNFRVFDGGVFSEHYLWLDQEKPPIKRA